MSTIRMYGDRDPRVIEGQRVLDEHERACSVCRTHEGPCKEPFHRATCGVSTAEWEKLARAYGYKRESGHTTHPCDEWCRLSDLVPKFSICSECHGPIELERATEPAQGMRPTWHAKEHVRMAYDADRARDEPGWGWGPVADGGRCDGSGKGPLCL